MKIIKATYKYESWLREELNVFEDDLAVKAQKLTEDPFLFLRGTFYHWIQVLPDLCKKAWDAPKVLSVGDLHAANFGTWRDAKDELIWGVNDLDEAASLPYTQDLIRLATSVELASESEKLKITLTEACAAILDGYREGLEKGGEPFVINNDKEWLKKAYVRSKESAEEYWKELDQLLVMEKDAPPDVRSMLEAGLPSQGMEYRILHRQAGVGSLGRPRYTALAEWQGGFVAREAKALIPSAALWAKKKLKGAEVKYEEVLAHAVRRLDPTLKVYEGWVVRGLAPDCCRIDLDELGPERDEARMMHAMGWEVANIHLGTRGKAKDVLADLKDRKKNWLVQYADRMVGAMLEEWDVWKGSLQDL